MMKCAAWILATATAACTVTHASSAGKFVTDIGARGEELAVTKCEIDYHEQYTDWLLERDYSHELTTSDCATIPVSLPAGIHTAQPVIPWHCRAQLAVWRRIAAGDPRNACLARRGELGRLAQRTSSAGERKEIFATMPTCAAPPPQYASARLAAWAAVDADCRAFAEAVVP